MFGYVIVNQASLSKEAAARYQASYCGLCHTLGALHGGSGRLALSYDLTFLNILLASLYEGDPTGEGETSGKRTCPIHPFQKRDFRTSAQTAYCADMSVALHYYAAKDKWNDDRSLAGFGFMKLLAQKQLAVKERYPRQCEVIATELATLSQYEAENAQDIEAVSSCFGRLMAGIFVMKQDFWAEDLATIGYYLGKYIYLLDAYDDLTKDVKKGNYNPLKTFSATPDYETQMEEILQDLMGRCAATFSRLPCLDDLDILENILYSGVWLRYFCKRKQGFAPLEENPPSD